MRHCSSKPARYSWQCIAPKTHHKKNILHPRPRDNAPKMHCTIVITPTRHHQRCLCNLHMRMPVSHAVTSQWAIWCVLATKQSYPPPLWGSVCHQQACAYSAQAWTMRSNFYRTHVSMRSNHQDLVEDLADTTSILTDDANHTIR